MMRINLIRQRPIKGNFKTHRPLHETLDEQPKRPLSEPPKMCAYIKGSTQKDGTADMPDSCKEKGCTGYSKLKHCNLFISAEELMGDE